MRTEGPFACLLSACTTREWLHIAVSEMMRVPLNDLQRGVEADGPALEAAIKQVLDSGWYVHGPQHQAFEREFAEYVGARHCLGVGSGTDALELALTALASPGRDVVVTAANAGGYTAVAARRSNLRLRFADVSSDTMCLDPDALADVLDDTVAAVVATHLYGRIADVDRLRKVCDGAGVPLVEDCAQAVGASHRGQRAGSFGDAATFSFYPTKNLGALGDAGAVLTSDSVLAEKIRALRQYGWASKYVVDHPNGRNSRLDEMQAAVLRVRLPMLEQGNSRRREIVARYEASAPVSMKLLPAQGEGHVAHLAVALCDDREKARAALADAGVQTEVHYPVPDHWQVALRGEHDGRPLPVTEKSAGAVLSLPCFPQLTDEEVNYVCDVLESL